MNPSNMSAESFKVERTSIVDPVSACAGIDVSTVGRTISMVTGTRALFVACKSSARPPAATVVYGDEFFVLNPKTLIRQPLPSVTANGTTAELLPSCA